MIEQFFDREIRGAILKNLAEVKNSIFIAVAWFTDQEILNIIKEKAHDGVAVEIILNNDEINKPIIQELSYKNIKIYFYESEQSNATMHHKFCILDKEVLLSGSYNWTYAAARKNHEDVSVIRYEPEVLLNYLKKFDELKNQCRLSDEALKNYAKYFYDLGLNVTCVSNIKNEFNSKAENIYLKAPNHQWEDLWSRRQTLEEFDGYQWSIATGFGLATGFKNLLAIDVDDCANDFIIQTLEILGLPFDYEWVVLSGSRRGFHVYVFVDDLLENFSKTTVIRLYPKELYAKLASKVELLIRLHSILPPSLHPSQNKYEFVNCSLPENLPVHVGMNKIQNFINKYFDPAKQKNMKTYKKKDKDNVGNSNDGAFGLLKRIATLIGKNL